MGLHSFPLNGIYNFNDGFHNTGGKTFDARASGCGIVYFYLLLFSRGIGLVCWKRNKLGIVSYMCEFINLTRKARAFVARFFIICL